MRGGGSDDFSQFDGLVAPKSDYDLPSLNDAASAFVPRIDGYEIENRLGEGGMGTVWRAVQSGTRRRVALKLMSRGVFSDTARLRFDREVELTARLEHPNIARVYDSGLHHGLYFYAMELIEGQPLDRYVESHNLTQRQTLELMRTIAQAVGHAHQRGIIHRDLKPSNILVSEDGLPHLLDFGLAKPTAESLEQAISMDSDVLGTPEFMSPEQAAGKSRQLDTRSDIYSLGATLFALLSGRLPHDMSGSRFECLRRIAQTEPPSLRSVAPHVDRELESIVQKAMALDPDQRYASAPDFAQDLDNYLHGEPLTARRASLVYVLRKRIRRNWIPVSISIGIIVLLFSTALVSYLKIAQSNRNALTAQHETEKQLAQSQRFQREAEENLAANLITTSQLLIDKGSSCEARQDIFQALSLNSALPVPRMGLLARLLDTYRSAPAPIMGIDGTSGGAGGLYPASGFSLCPDGKTAMSLSPDGYLGIWDLRTGVRLRALGPKSENHNTFAISADGKLFLCWHDHQAELYDVASAARVGQLVGAKAIHNGTFSPDSRLLVTTDLSVDPRVRIWDVRSGKIVHDLEPPTQPGQKRFSGCVKFSADGKRLFSGHGAGTVAEWDVASGKLLRTFVGGIGLTYAFALCSDESRLLCEGAPPTLWDVRTGRLIRGFDSLSGTLAFLPDSSIAVNSDHGRLELWDLSTNTKLRTFYGHRNDIDDAALLDGGRLAVTQATDLTLRVWDLTGDNDVLQLAGREHPAIAICFAHHGLTLLSCSADEVCLHDVATGKLLWTSRQRSGIVGLAVSPDGAMACTGGPRLSVWDLNSGRILRDLQVPHSASTLCIAWSADGSCVLTGETDGGLYLWDAVSGKLLREFTGHSAAVYWCSFRTNDTVASVGQDITSRTWNLKSGKQLAKTANDWNFVIYRPQVHLEIVGEYYHSGIRAFRMASNFEAGRLYSQANITCVDCTPDGSAVVAGCNDGHICLWDLTPINSLIESEHRLTQAANAAIQPMYVFGGNAAPLTSVAWSPRGNCFASAGSDGKILIWDLNRTVRYHDFEKELGTAREALARDHGDAAALLSFADWYAFRGVDDWATELYERAQKSGAAPSQLTLARCYWKLGNLAAARTHFELALKQKNAPKKYLGLCIDSLTPPSPSTKNQPATRSAPVSKHPI